MSGKTDIILKYSSAENKKICPRCETENDFENAVCYFCGTDLSVNYRETPIKETPIFDVKRVSDADAVNQADNSKIKEHSDLLERVCIIAASIMIPFVICLICAFLDSIWH